MHQALRTFGGGVTDPKPNDSAVPPIGAANDKRAAFHQRRKSSLKRLGSNSSICRPPVRAETPVDAATASSNRWVVDKENLGAQDEPGPTADSNSCQSYRSPATESMLSVLTKPADEHWRTTLQLRKAREEAAAVKAQIDKGSAEESKWDGVPAWKRQLLEAKAKRKAEEQRPERDAIEAEAREAEKFRSMPAWRQQLIINKMNR